MAVEWRVGPGVPSLARGAAELLWLDLSFMRLVGAVVHPVVCAAVVLPGNLSRVFAFVSVGWLAAVSGGAFRSIGHLRDQRRRNRHFSAAPRPRRF